MTEMTEMTEEVHFTHRTDTAENRALLETIIPVIGKILKDNIQLIIDNMNRVMLNVYTYVQTSLLDIEVYDSSIVIGLTRRHCLVEPNNYIHLKYDTHTKIDIYKIEYIHSKYVIIGYLKRDDCFIYFPFTYYE